MARCLAVPMTSEQASQGNVEDNISLSKQQAERRSVWQRATERHDQAVVRARARFGGEIFSRAPFDLIDSQGRFVEVKIARFRKQKSLHQWRINLTREEIRFAALQPLHLYVEWDKNISLIPMSCYNDRLRNRKVQKFTYKGVDRWVLPFDIPHSDLDKYIIWGIPLSMRHMMGSAKDYGLSKFRRRTRVPFEPQAEPQEQAEGAASQGE